MRAVRAYAIRQPNHSIGPHMNDKHPVTLSTLCRLLGVSQSQLTCLAQHYGVINQRDNIVIWWQYLWVSLQAVLYGESRHRDRQQLFRSTFGRTATTNTFSDWLTRFPPEFFITLIEMVSDQIDRGTRAVSRESAGILKKLRLEDSSFFPANRRLRHIVGCMPGRPMAAGLKLFVGLNVAGDFGFRVRVKEARVADARYVSRETKDSAQIRDRGWFSMPLFCRWVEQGRWFISRIQRSFNPLIVGVRVGNQDWDGKRLHDIDLSSEDAVDLIVRPRQRGTALKLKNGERLKLRLVGERVQDRRRKRRTDKWRWYLVHLPDTNRFTFQDIASLYRARWRIEEVFREIKSGFRVQVQRLRNERNAMNQIYLLVLTWMLSHRVLRLISHQRRRSSDGFRLDNVLKGPGRQLMIQLLNGLACTQWRITSSMGDLIDGIFRVGFSSKRACSHPNRAWKAALAKAADP